MASRDKIVCVVRKRWSSVTDVVLRTSENIRRHTMNDIIKNIEAAQLKAEVPEFRVGDTVRVYAEIKEGNLSLIHI